MKTLKTVNRARESDAGGLGTPFTSHWSTGTTLGALYEIRQLAP